MRDDRFRNPGRARRLVALGSGALLVAFAALAAWALSSARSGIVELTMDMRGYSRETIRVRVGDPVTVRMSVPESPFFPDGEGGEHQFTVDELGVDLIVPPGETGEVTFTPPQPGTYEYYCDTCCGGRVNPSMRGELVVHDSTKPRGSNVP